MTLFLNNEIEEIPTIEKNNDFRNRSNFETLNDHKPATHINTKMGNKNFFLFLFFLDFPLQPLTRRFRIRCSFELLCAISPTIEFNGSGKILRLNTSVEASWRIFRFDDWGQPRLLAQTICWSFGVGLDCKMGNDLGLQRGDSTVVLEIGN